MARQRLGDIIFRQVADHLLGQLTALEKAACRNAADIELFRAYSRYHPHSFFTTFNLAKIFSGNFGYGWLRQHQVHGRHHEAQKSTITGCGVLLASITSA